MLLFVNVATCVAEATTVAVEMEAAVVVVKIPVAMVDRVRKVPKTPNPHVSYVENLDTVVKCWYRFDTSFQPEEKMAGSATTASYQVDTNWYVDSGATDHITGELDKLTVGEKYGGQDQVHTASRSGMMISHVGHSVYSTKSQSSS